MGFDFKTRQILKYYVYALIDPASGQPFYIGKGINDRVFDHIACALDSVTENDKYAKIQEIQGNGLKVTHLIIRHGMNERTAFQVESALIDLTLWLKKPLTNKALGHHSIEFGLATANEIIRRNNAEPLDAMGRDCVLININKTYKRAMGVDAIYQATKESWVIAKCRLGNIKYALSEYRGLIVEVYRIYDKGWYPVNSRDKNGKKKIRYGFNGEVAENITRQKYIDKSVAHLKKQGATNPIRFNL